MGKYEEREGDDMKTGSAKVGKTRGPVTLAVKTAIGAVRMRCLYTRSTGASQDTRSTALGPQEQTSAKKRIYRKVSERVC
ncbi:hypothetical protein TGME49_289160 [Toxoplasma gondii ME49]|uniref:Uncharacterized protein n=2 Tax=Toxoplasma gondii TaxID=5811 RepID=S8EWU7_TOXGM|nr:hypothetical protein TGME49_289160 [Toxoplasma gondii ME49]EPT27916.1 hypothetical protein TGME49_289160 [Toxoplasma gondii ME49]KYF45182.1 hypothetical protein TGARI_289160 [Toxoplasma gondii ARI]|eukprot:XP_018636389.1 hypothetical protein TGME49_289160 [Toxoplasma gondii ME49]